MNQPFNPKPSSNPPQASRSDPDGKQSFQIAAPSISLPKGGGAIRGIGEKFAANPVTGTGSMTVPIATSPGRSGFSPQLSLSYDSGAGNGPFGFGWSLSLPSMTRKTDKGLPKYQDADESDVFILSAAEDLVPMLVESGGQWQRETLPSRIVDGKTYRIQRYRPRIEGLFAHIERWTNQANPQDTFWRSISKENITTWYGKTENSRISDPADPTRIFSWLICESYDDKGNVIVYGYKAENSEEVELSDAHEKNRTLSSRSANRYLKRIKYGNRQPNRDADWNATDPAQLPDSTWMFEVVFDYGEHYTENDQGQPTAVTIQDNQVSWAIRQDPFSSYRAGFEVRTYRLCQRVLMFHHFPDELGTADYLVRSTDFTYNQSPIASFITQVTQSGYVLKPNGTYLKKRLPPLAFEYSPATVSEEIRIVEPESLENLPVGADGLHYQLLDLDGEGVQGVLSEQVDGWYFKRNVSPISVVKENGKEKTVARFEPLVQVSAHPSIAEGMGARHQFLDLAGDGQLDLVQFETPVSGFFERTHDERWESFIPFESVPNLPWNDPNLRFLDLTGDGHADILITDHDALTWYPSLAEEGFGTAIRIPTPRDEEEGPAVVFADGTQAIFVADLSGDGLSDIVRIRNGEVCYWSNLGYGRFGAKVTMDNAPWFDAPDQFDQKRIRLADIDGSGTTDIIYLERNRVAIYRNECGNRWGPPEYLTTFPAVDDLSSVVAVDLLGNGTACLVWTSPLPGDTRQPMRYIDLMGGQKPHLLIKTVNNLGAETHVHYAPSTKFYLADKRDGKPWITRLPFPVHVVERVETHDLISRNRFVTRNAYHQGYYDGIEREFRGFGRVDQFDTEEFAALKDFSFAPAGGEGQGEGEPATNIDEASHVPPVLTKTWFHIGAYVGRNHVSDFFAGLLDGEDKGEYYREPGLTDAQARALLLPDTVLPPDLTAQEEREACRALKGMMLRQEVYALDGTNKAEHPYVITEQNFAIRPLQPRNGNRHGVFFAHPREAISYHYERNPADPRISHSLTLEVDDFGNVLKSAAIGYGRRPGQSPLEGDDRAKQEQLFVTYTENDLTNAVEEPDDYRARLPCESRTYELTGYTPTGAEGRYQPTDFVRPDPNDPKRLVHIFDSEIDYEEQPTNGNQRRLIERVRTLYRRNDLPGLLPLGELESMALPGESYKLAFTPGLLAQVYQRAAENLLPDAATLLAANVPGAQVADRGGYVDLDNDGHWWIPSGRVFFDINADDQNPAATAPQELTEARRHFFLPRKYTDPFGHSSRVDYGQPHDLLIVRTEDTAHNVVLAENDYRVLQPTLVTDPNGNQSDVTFDALGLVVGTAVMGKPDENPRKGDLLDDDFQTDLTHDLIDGFFEAIDPHDFAPALLANATTRIIYDLDRFKRVGEPPFAATLARETHFRDPLPPEGLKIQISFSYSDGFGREIQKKIQAEPVAGTGPDVNPRWVGSGWTIFNNKGKPVRQYEPFFSTLPDRRHQFEFARTEGVSPILFYDPVERVVATLHPNHTYEKVVFDPWQQTTYDVNDTVLLDPGSDSDVSGFFTCLLDDDYLPSWHTLRTDPALALLEWPGDDNAQRRANDDSAARKAAVHANTPTKANFDALGRPFLSIADNGVDENGQEQLYETRVELNIEGNQRAVIDARGRAVMTYDYDMLGNRIHQVSMDAGTRWMLNDVTGKPIRAWDSRAHAFRTEYDESHRPTHLYVQRGNGTEVLVERTVYGESHPEAIPLNMRGKVYQHYDQAGVVTNVGRNPVTNHDEAYDFKGSLLRSNRRLAQEYRLTVDWLPLRGLADVAEIRAAAEPLLESETFTSRTTYDALNRPIQLIAPHSDRSAHLDVIRPGYNDANLLEKIDVWLQRQEEPDELLDPDSADQHFVTNIDYNSKGQRERIEYGNDAITEYTYDEKTFRLLRLKTTRMSFPADEQIVQDLGYTYDPAGNITHIQDGAQQTIYFNNQVVTPSNDYRYDAVYRLIHAEGREHIGQTSQPQTTWDDQFRVRLPHPGDGQAMRRYSEEYHYDAVGNFQQLIHQAANDYCTRGYAYNEPSLLELGEQSNQLSSTTVHPNGNQPIVEPYTHDAHGNMTRMNHLPLMRWDYRDQLQATAQEVVNEGSPETTWYMYDAGGQRVRKVTERQAAPGQAPTRKEERIYLGGFEVYRKYNGNGSTVTLERETLHIMDDKQRIALVETKTVDSASPLTPDASLIRYQFGNHLGSASLELDAAGEIISYEEYYPYGSTSYQAVRSDVEVSPKRYRYTGMERDEESGLNYHGARYYAPWLGRWTSCDPISSRGGIGLYIAVSNNPIGRVDKEGLQDGGFTYSYAPPEHRPEPEEQRIARRAQETLRTPEGLETMAADLRAEMRIPSPRGWMARGEGNIHRIDFTRHYEGAGNRLAVERILKRMSNVSTARRVNRQLEALGDTTDKSLVLAVAFREMGPAVFSRDPSTINTYLHGGIDFPAPRSFVPRGFGPWESGGDRGMLIPKTELIVATGAGLAFARQRFFEEVRRLQEEGRLENDPRLTARTLREWTMVFFQGSGGLPYREYLRVRRQPGVRESEILGGDNNSYPSCGTDRTTPVNRFE